MSALRHNVRHKSIATRRVRQTFDVVWCVRASLRPVRLVRRREKRAFDDELEFVLRRTCGVVCIARKRHDDLRESFECVRATTCLRDEVRQTRARALIDVTRRGRDSSSCRIYRTDARMGRVISSVVTCTRCTPRRSAIVRGHRGRWLWKTLLEQRPGRRARREVGHVVLLVVGNCRRSFGRRC